MNYDDIMKWRRTNYNKVYNTLENKITKNIMKQDINREKNDTLYKVNRLLYQAKK